MLSMKKEVIIFFSFTNKINENNAFEFFLKLVAKKNSFEKNHVPWEQGLKLLWGTIMFSKKQRFKFFLRKQFISKQTKT